ncbi:MAG: hypothetical protein OEV42_13870 [Deltaproteobacteria bacterium]|nr:hypothetical protein [Deltaproteobacteria bacterium]
MFSFFNKKPLIEEEISNWIILAFEWALKNYGSDVFHNETILVTPSSKHFPEKLSSPDEMVTYTFEQVRKYAGMENWPCKLQAQEDDINPVVAPTIVLKGAPSGPGGTFQYSDEAVITYNTNLINRPEPLAATFAHELAHYLSGIAKEPPPGGEEYWEHATDLTAIFLGFGIFLANSAFTFEQFTSVDSQGWSSSRQGYMTEQEILYSLALFCVLKNIEISEVIPYLDSHLRGFFKKCYKELQGSEHISKLHKINVTQEQLSSNNSIQQTPENGAADG